MSQTSDGDFTVAGQHGAKKVALPLQTIGNNYATEITRRYRRTAATYDPIRDTLTGYINHVLRSDDFSNASWTKAAATGTANAATDHEGGTTATKLAEDGATSAHNASQVLIVASGVLNFGALLKASERTFARLRINNVSNGDLAIAVFNLSTGAVVSGTGTIKKLLNGWYWCYVTGTASVANSACFVDLTADGSTFSYTGTVGSGIYAWKMTAIAGAQTTPWPAIATTAATRAVTTNAVDADDPTAFLVDEQEPESGELEYGMALWSRRYANVPAPTIHYSTIALTKPAPAALGALGGFTVRDGPGGTALGAGFGYGLYYFGNNQVYGPYSATTSANSGGNTRVTWTGHGLAGTEAIMARDNSAAGLYIFISGEYTVVDPNTVDLLGINLGVNVTSCAEYRRAYTFGADRIRTRITETFYLPGYTVGVPLVTDIPVPDPLINDLALFDAMVATTSGFLTYDADALDFWDGRAPIYRQRTIDIDMATL